jgi:hypothetical protein
MSAVACVTGLGAVLVAAMAHAFWLSRLYRRRARREQLADVTGAIGAGSPLLPGPVTLTGTLLQGEVAPEGATGASRAPLAVVIEQTGSEETRGGWVSHRWAETSRQVNARPFRLLLDGGQTVRVEPGADVVLQGPTERLEGMSARQRRRTASIAAGTRIHVRGELRTGLDPAAAGATGYRDPGRSLVLAGSPDRPLVCSTAPLHARDAARAEWYRSTAVLFAILLGITQLGIYARFHLLNAFGQQVMASDARVTTHRISRRSPRVDVTATASFVDAAGRHRLVDRVRFDEIPRPRSASIYTLLPAFPALHTVGMPRVGLHLFFWVSLLCGALIAGHLRRVLREDRDHPWYQQGPLVEEGTGPLPPASTQEQA